MSDSVFFSWQSDIDEAITKAVIRKAIQRAIKEVNREISLENAEREPLKYDADTMGETGNPSIVNTIFSKIESAAAFVADVSYIATVENDGRKKGIPNANVMIEYGYALKVLHGDKEKAQRKTILIMNIAFGQPPEIELPFDLNHLRWPIQFNLPCDSSDENKKKVVDNLTNILKGNFRKLCSPPENEEMSVIVRLRSVSQHNEIDTLTRCESMNELIDTKILTAKKFLQDIQNQPDGNIIVTRGSTQLILNGVAQGRRVKTALQKRVEAYELEWERLKADLSSYTNFRQQNAIDCYIAVENIGNITLTDVRITIELPDWLLAFRNNMARSLPSPIDISTQHGNWQVTGGDYPKKANENESYGETVRVEFHLLTLEIDRIVKRREFEAVEASDSFTLLASPNGNSGPCSLKVVVDAEELDKPFMGKIEIEIK